MGATVWTTVGLVAVGMVVAYLIGSIPNGVIVGKLLFGVDIRKHGSGNIGTTNALRIGGWKNGALVMVLDILKGALGPLFMLFILWIIANPVAAAMGPIVMNVWAGWFHDLAMGLALLCTAFGHMHSVFLKFSGGKGIATSFGGFLVVCPWCALTSLVAFILLTVITRYVSVGSLAGAAGYLIGTLVFYNHSIALIIVSIVICLLVVYAHRGNIKRLIHGEESRFHVGSKDELEAAKASEAADADEPSVPDESPTPDESGDVILSEAKDLAQPAEGSSSSTPEEA